MPSDPYLLVRYGDRQPFLIAGDEPDLLREIAAHFFTKLTEAAVPELLSGRVTVTRKLQGAVSPAATPTLTVESDAFVLSSPDFRATVSACAIEPQVRVNVLTREAYAAPSAVHHALRLACAARALWSGGVLVHSAAVELDGAGLVFHGPSGIGKSTLSALAQSGGGRVLSDDLNVIGFPDERPLVRALRNAGRLGPVDDSVREAPLTAIFKLEQASHHEVQPLPAGSAVGALMTNLAYVARHPACHEQALQNLARLVSAVPAFRLRFRPDAGFLPLVREVIAR